MFVYCDQQARAHYSFGPLSVCLSMNYWDRFLSVYPLPVSSEIGRTRNLDLFFLFQYHMMCFRSCCLCS